MRCVLCLLLVAGCFGQLDANGRPSVIPKLSAMPADPEKRDAILDQSASTAGPENGKGLTKKERKAVTSAAFVAAFIGAMFSKSSNVLPGFATTFDETRRSTKIQPRRAGAGQDTEGRGSGSSATLHDDESVLVPWVNLKAPSNAPTSPR